MISNQENYLLLLLLRVSCGYWDIYIKDFLGIFLSDVYDAVNMKNNFLNNHNFWNPELYWNQFNNKSSSWNQLILFMSIVGNLNLY